jgi:hypothetical protein
MTENRKVCCHSVWITVVHWTSRLKKKRPGLFADLSSVPVRRVWANLYLYRAIWHALQLAVLAAMSYTCTGQTPSLNIGNISDCLNKGLLSFSFYFWSPSAYASGSTSALWLIVPSPYWTFQLSPSVTRCHGPSSEKAEVVNLFNLDVSNFRY